MTSERRSIGVLAALAALLGALVVLAGSLDGLEFGPGRPLAPIAIPTQTPAPRPDTAAAPASGELVAGGLRGLVLLVFLLLALALLRRRLRWAILALALLFALLMSDLRQPARRALPPPGPGQPPLPLGSSRPPPELLANPPTWLVVGLSLVCLLLLGAGLWLLRRRLRPALPAAPAPQPALALLAHEARQALAALQGGEQVRETVLRCYLEMRRILSEQSGLRRDQTMTAREFEQRLRDAGLHDESVRQLSELFERYRYGRRGPGAAEERQASACLSAIVERYGAAR